MRREYGAADALCPDRGEEPLSIFREGDLSGFVDRLDRREEAGACAEPESLAGRADETVPGGQSEADAPERGSGAGPAPRAFPERGGARASALSLADEEARAADAERMADAMTRFVRAIPAEDPVIAGEVEQVRFMRRLATMIAELEWRAQGESRAHSELAGALDRYRSQLQGLSRELERSNRLLTRDRREHRALVKEIEVTRERARQLSSAHRLWFSSRRYESELRKLVIYQDRRITLQERESREMGKRRRLMREAQDMAGELMQFADRLAAAPIEVGRRLVAPGGAR